MRRIALALVLLLGVSAAACSSHSGARKDSGLGTRVLDCVVVEREHEAPGSGGSSFTGSGNYYLVFQTHEGQATATYRFQVNRTQWFRFPEGARVRITLNNNNLQDIRPND